MIYKVPNDNTTPGHRNAFIRRIVFRLVTIYEILMQQTDASLNEQIISEKKRFKFIGAMLWNQLPNKEKLAKSVHSFKEYINTIFL